MVSQQPIKRFVRNGIANEKGCVGNREDNNVGDAKPCSHDMNKVFKPAMPAKDDTDLQGDRHWQDR